MDWNRIFNIGLVPAFIEQNPSLDPGMKALLLVGSAILVAIIAYLLGSLNFAIMISRFKHDDIRDHGSKNAGTTNMLRTYGKKMAVVTLLGDFLKAVVAVMIGSFICMGLPFVNGTYVAALFCVLGHVFPIYYKFKGGKGIATAAGAIIACGEPIVLLILVLIFAIIVIGTRYVSLASVMVALLYPVILDRFYAMHSAAGRHHNSLNVVMALIIALLIFLKHWENIKRLWNHTERKISFGKKKKDGESEEADELPEGQKPKKKSLHHDDDDDEEKEQQ